MCSPYYLIIFNLWYIIIATCIASGPLNDYVMQVPPKPLGYYSRDRLHITANVFSFFFLNYYGKTSINELGANSHFCEDNSELELGPLLISDYIILYYNWTGTIYSSVSRNSGKSKWLKVKSGQGKNELMSCTTFWRRANSNYYVRTTLNLKQSICFASSMKWVFHTPPVLHHHQSPSLWTFFSYFLIANYSYFCANQAKWTVATGLPII